MTEEIIIINNDELAKKKLLLKLAWENYKKIEDECNKKSMEAWEQFHKIREELRFDEAWVLENTNLQLSLNFEWTEAIK